MNPRMLVCGIALATLSSSAAIAAPLYTGSAVGPLESPGSTSFSFDAVATAAQLDFDLIGYLTLDGDNNGWSDALTLTFNGTAIFSGMFNMGGGGASVVTLAPTGTTWSTYTNGCTPDPYNCTTIPSNGGLTRVSLPLTLVGGTNTLVFSYTGTAQGLGDEGWGVNSLTVSAVPEPETYAMLLAGLGLLGVAARWRRRRID